MKVKSRPRLSDNVRFEVLDVVHAAALLHFEQENKAWFEQMIAPRSPLFYTDEGVVEHIETYLADMRDGFMHPLTVWIDNRIVARANLRDISFAGESASIGYRVAEAYGGQGIASACVVKLEEVASGTLGLATLKADVLDNNPVSKHILEKHGFSMVQHEKNDTEINGSPLGRTTFRKNIVRL
ncbi:MAG: GNAT family N-acetyltransferase [Rhodothermales bacterium]